MKTWATCRGEGSVYAPGAGGPAGDLEWIASDSPATADRVYHAIEKHCDSLRHHAQLGRPRPEIGEGARSVVIERWVAFYRIVEDGVQIVRIVDGARDLSKLKWPLE